MAFTKFGDNTYKFSFDAAEAAAIAAATGLKPQELQINSEPEYVAEALDEAGETAAVAVGEDKRTFTMSGYIVDETKFDEQGLDFTFDSKFFIITGRQKTEAARDYAKGQLTGVSYKNVTAEIVAT